MCVWNGPPPHPLMAAHQHAVTAIAMPGEGNIRNRENSAQQTCAKLCDRILRAIFLGVIVAALGMHMSIVPDKKYPEASRN